MDENTKKFLPSRKILSLFILVFGIVASILITYNNNGATTIKNGVGNLVAGDKISIPDNPDWESEFKALSNNLNPIELASSTDTETYTDSISKSLMLNYLTLKNQGDLSQSSAQELVDTTINYIDSLGSNKLESVSLRIVPDNGKISLLEYGDKLGNILKVNKPKELENELKIIEAAVTTKDVAKLNDLDNVVITYEKIASEMAVMSVPKIFVKAHTDMVNGLRVMALGVKEMKAVFEDPFRGLAGMQTYQEGGRVFIEAYQATVLFMLQNKVNYKQGTGGYYLYYGI